MAGATNKAMKAAGLPKKTQETVRVALGAGFTVQSAIQHAQAHGLKLGRAEKHATPLTGWQKAAAGATSQAEHAAARSAREAHVAAESRKAALKAAMDTRQRNLGRALGAASHGMMASRKATVAAAKAAAAEAAKPKFKGAGPFNQERHLAKSERLLSARSAQVEQARRHVNSLQTRGASNAEVQSARVAYGKLMGKKERTYNLVSRAQFKRDRAQRAKDAARAGERRVQEAARTLRKGRNAVAALGAAGKGQGHIMTNKGARVVPAVAESKHFFVADHNGRFAVVHKATGTTVTSVGTAAAAKSVLSGIGKTGHLTMQRMEQGGAAGARAAKALSKYLSAPKRI